MIVEALQSRFSGIVCALCHSVD